MRKLALIVGAALQVGSGWWLINGGGVATVLALHVLGAAAWGWSSAFLVPGRNPAAAWLTGTAALLLPGAGWLGSLCMIGLTRATPPPRRSRALLVWSERSVRGGGGLAPVAGTRASVAQILRGPDAAARRNAILALKELDTRSALPLLRKGLQDSDEQVRIYAQNTLSGLLERFEGSIKVFERRATEQPGEVAALIGLAEQYFELVYLDVAGDEETSAHLLGKAVALVERAVEQAPTDPRVALLRLRYALRQRDVAGAAQALARVERLGVDRQMIMPWQAELAYQQGDWARLREVLAQFHREGYVNPRIEALGRFWMGAAAA